MCQWKWGDSGVTRSISRKNPLRWSGWSPLDETVRELKQEELKHEEPALRLQRHSSGARGGGGAGRKVRPVEVRLRGEERIYSFDAAGEAWRWLDETQGDGVAAESHWWKELLRRVREFLCAQKLTYLQKLALDAGTPALVLQQVKSAAAAASGGGAEVEHTKLQALLWEHVTKLTQVSLSLSLALSLALALSLSLCVCVWVCV